VTENEQELNEEEMRDTIEMKLTSTNEAIEIHEGEGAIVGDIKGKDTVGDESTRRDINMTGRSTGFTYRPGLNETLVVDNLITEAAIRGPLTEMGTTVVVEEHEFNQELSNINDSDAVMENTVDSGIHSLNGVESSVDSLRRSQRA
jgi:hypothetical protein